MLGLILFFGKAIVRFKFRWIFILLILVFIYWVGVFVIRVVVFWCKFVFILILWKNF